MKYKIVAVGKIKEQFYRDAVAEYVKRLSRFGKVEIVETDECYFSGVPSPSDVARILQTEAKGILPKLEGFVFVLDVVGKQISSPQLAEAIVLAKQKHSTLTFVIGGSHGLDDSVKAAANERVSFGKITLPHQLCRVVLAEQIYRAAMIETNGNYHK